MRVEILAMTPNATTLIYSAFRQCYSKDYVGDKFWEWVKGETPTNEQESFIRRMLQQGHESPLEHVSFTFAVEGISRVCSHQLVRHRIASYSQQSMRYVNMKDGFKYITPESVKKHEFAYTKYKNFMREAQVIYDLLISYRVPPEDARMVLPHATETKIVFTMNIRSLINFFSLRCCSLAQWEIRELAWKMLKMLRERLPFIFNNLGPKCKMLGFCPEDPNKSCGLTPTLKGRVND